MSKVAGQRVVWKFPFIDASTQVPAVATVLHVDMQDRAVFAWCLLDPDADKKLTKTVRVVGTGYEADIDGWRFINTFLTDGGTYVFHAFVDDRAELIQEQP